LRSRGPPVLTARAEGSMMKARGLVTWDFLFAALLASACSDARHVDEVRDTALANAVAPPGAYRCVTSRALQDVRAIALDSQGAVIVASGPAYMTQGSVSIVRKLDADGRPLWTYRPPPGDTLWFSAMTSDADGNVFIAGSKSRTAHQPGRPDRTFGTLLLMKLDAAGRLVWSFTPGTEGNLLRVMTTPSGDVVVSGRCRWAEQSMRWWMVARYDGAGRQLWGKSYGLSDEMMAAYDVATDAAGNVVVAGRFSSPFDFGAGPIAPTRSPEDPDVPDGFIAKYDASGRHLWSKHFGDDRYQEVTAVAVNPGGDVVAVSARNDGSIDFGGGRIQGPAIAALDAQGNHLWSRALPGIFAFVGADASGAFTLGGGFPGSVDLGAGPVVNAGSGNSYLARFDVGGQPLASTRLGGPHGVTMWHFGLAPQGSLVLSGGLGGPVDLGCGMLEPGPSANDFVVMLAPVSASGGGGGGS